MDISILSLWREMLSVGGAVASILGLLIGFGIGRPVGIRKGKRMVQEQRYETQTGVKGYQKQEIK